MPRAQIDRHFSRDDEFRQALIDSPEAKRIVSRLNRRLRANSSISSGELSKLLKVPRSSLLEQNIAPPHKRSGSAPHTFDRTQARILLARYLPRALGWKRVQECADEHKLHRNQIERIVRHRGEAGDLLIAEDKRLYLSPRAEKVVRQAVKELETFADHLAPKQLADRCRVGLNLVTSYFSARSVKIARDPLGHARLSPKQVEQFEEWRIKVALREELPDKKIDGIPYRALKRAATERAELLAPRENERHEIALRKCEHALRHICNQGGILEHTELGPYLPQSLSESYRIRISVPDAARIIGTSTATVKAWRSKHSELLPPPLPGRYARDLHLFAVIERAAQKYLEEPKFRKRQFVPGQIVYFQIRSLAERLHLDWRGLMECAIPNEKTRARLLQHSSRLARSTFEDLQDLVADYKYHAPVRSLSGKPSPGHYSNLAHVLGIEALVVPAELMIHLINICQAHKGQSAAYFYGCVRDLCERRGLYPPDMTALQRCHQHNMRISPFPLLAALFLETAIESSQACYHLTNLPWRAAGGDLVIDSREHDFGVVKRTYRNFADTVATIAMYRSQRQIEVKLAPRAYCRRSGTE